MKGWKYDKYDGCYGAYIKKREAERKPQGGMFGAVVMTVIVCIAIAGWLDTPAKASAPKIARFIEVPAPPPPLHLIGRAE